MLEQKYDDYGIIIGNENIAKFVKNNGDAVSKTLPKEVQEDLKESINDLVKYNKWVWPEAYKELGKQMSKSEKTNYWE